MPVVAALYRHPVKGFTPEALVEAQLTAGDWFPGDRMYAVENGPSGFDPLAPVQMSKTRFAVLMREASLARVRTQWDETTNVLTVEGDDTPSLAVDLDSADDRARFETWLTAWLAVQGQDDVDWGRLRLLASGARHRFMDSSKGHVSVLNLASVRDLEARLGLSVDPRRFRANILVEGWEPWVENDWTGQTLIIGPVALKGVKPIVRCAATQVDPDAGVRDLDVTAALIHHYGHVLCGLYCAIESSGPIALGDTVSLHDPSPRAPSLRDSSLRDPVSRPE